MALGDCYCNRATIFKLPLVKLPQHSYWHLSLPRSNHTLSIPHTHTRRDGPCTENCIPTREHAHTVSNGTCHACTQTRIHIHRQFWPLLQKQTITRWLFFALFLQQYLNLSGWIFNCNQKVQPLGNSNLIYFSTQDNMFLYIQVFFFANKYEEQVYKKTKWWMSHQCTTQCIVIEWKIYYQDSQLEWLPFRPTSLFNTAVPNRKMTLAPPEEF